MLSCKRLTDPQIGRKIKGRASPLHPARPEVYPVGVSFSTTKLDRLFAECLPLVETRRVSRRTDVRRKMHPQAFALPSERKYPIHDAHHAELALTHLYRAAAKSGPDRKTARKVLNAVSKRWPNVFKAHTALVDKIRKAHGVAA